MKIIELSQVESETVERAFYEVDSYEKIMAVLNRQLNAKANSDTKEIIMHYAELCRMAHMKLQMAQNAVLKNHIDLSSEPFDGYQFDFGRKEVRLFEKQTV